MTRSNPSQILAIDLVRFVCALLVVAHHYAAMLPVAPPSWTGSVTLPRDWAGWSWAGWVGVELFFVVSGYVIALSASDGSAALFLRRRALRLIPAAWTCATIASGVALAAGLFTPAATLSRWFASMIFFPLAPQADPSSWTLAIEISFYLLVAAAMRRGGANAKSVETVGLALAMASLAYWLMRSAAVLPVVGSPIADTLLDLTLLPHGAFFATGIALWARGSGWTWRSAVTLCVGLAGCLLEIADRARFMAAGLGLQSGPALPLLLFALGLVLIVGAKPLQSILGRAVGARTLRTIGLATYPLYLIHQQTGFVAILALRRAGVSPHVAMILTAAAAVVVSLCIARWLEPAVRHWLAARIDALSRRGSRRDTPPSASLPAG